MSSKGENDVGRDESKEFEKRMMNVLRRMMAEVGDTARHNERLADTSEQLEFFSGELESLPVKEWLNRLELSRDIGQWSDAKTRSVLLTKLTGAARSWHVKVGVHIHSLDEWRRRFSEQFSDRQRLRLFENDLNVRIKNGGDPLELYVWRSASLAAQLGMSPADAKGQILRGLQNNYKFLETELRDRNHNDIPELLRDIERTIKFNKSLAGVVRVSEYQVRLSWVPCSGGKKPENAVRGGTDSDDEPLYVARALQGGDLTPGKLKRTHSVTYVAFYSKEIGHTNYEVLVADCPVEWVKCTSQATSLPAGAIQGGHIKEGTPLYIGRAHHRGSLTCGKVLWPMKKCFVSWGGQEWEYEDFEVLTCQSIDLH